MKRQLKNALLAIHKYTGIVFSLVFVMWFMSGIMMIFGGFPHVDHQREFQLSESFSPEQLDGLAAVPVAKSGKVSLEKLQGQLVYRIKTGRKSEKVIDAATGKQLKQFSDSLCRKVALTYTAGSVAGCDTLNRLDQWIPWSYYRALLPIYKYRLNDSAHSRVYVSSKNAKVLQATTRKSRWIARIGAIPHWIYFKSLRLKAALWASVVVWISGIGSLVSLIGIVVGFIRLRRQKQWRKNGGNRITPYKKFWLRWHHLSGFFFGLFVFTFVLSGMFSIADLPQWLVKKGEFAGARGQWNSYLRSAPKDSALSVAELHENLPGNLRIRKLVFSGYKGQPAVLVYTNNYRVPQIYARQANGLSRVKKVAFAQLQQQLQQQFPTAAISCDTLNAYTNYYLKAVMGYHPLPVWQFNLKESNGAVTWLYVDPRTQQAVFLLDRNGRFHRWVYEGLHKLNFKYFNQHLLLQKIVLILLSLGGLAISVTGVVLAWKRIRRIFSSKKKRRLL